MNTNPNGLTLRFVVIVSMALLISTLTAHGKMIVDWGGDYVTGSKSLVLPTGIDNGGTRTYPYSTTVPITPATDYTAPIGKNSTLYGASELICLDGTPRNHSGRISDVSTNDVIYFLGVSGVGGSLKGVVFFIKSDFLGGYSAGNLSLLKLRGRINMTQRAESGSVRFVVRDENNQWYISQSERSSVGVLEIESLYNASWGVWDPSGTPISALPSTYDVAGSAINGVTAFGYYFIATRPTSAASISIGGFQIEYIPQVATVISVK